MSMKDKTGYLRVALRSTSSTRESMMKSTQTSQTKIGTVMLTMKAKFAVEAIADVVLICGDKTLTRRGWK